MGITKTTQFSARTLQRAQRFKAIGHPARLAIVEHLLNTPSCVSGEFQSVTGLAQATVSKHLSELKASGWIEGDINGNAICYCLNEDAISLLQEFTNESLKHLQKRSTCC